MGMVDGRVASDERGLELVPREGFDPVQGIKDASLHRLETIGQANELTPEIHIGREQGHVLLIIGGNVHLFQVLGALEGRLFNAVPEASIQFFIIFWFSLS